MRLRAAPGAPNMACTRSGCRQWRDSATQALAQPQEQGASPQQTKQDRRRIKERNASCGARRGTGRDSPATAAAQAQLWCWDMTYLARSCWGAGSTSTRS